MNAATGVAQRLRGPALTLGAQALSSLTNFLVGAFALAADDLGSFGRFSIAYQLCLIVIAIGHGSTGNSVLIHAVRGGDERSDAVRAGASTAAVLVGLAAGIVLVVAGVAVGGDMRTPLLLAGAGSVGLVCQYTLRAARFALSDPAGVIRADGIWLAVLLGFAAFDLATDVSPGANGYLAAWLVGAAVSALPVIAVGVGNGRQHIGEYWEATGPQAVRTGIDSLLARSVFVVTLIAAEVIVDDTASGALAAAVLVFSPMGVVTASASALVVPSEVRAYGVHAAPFWVPMRAAAVICSIMAAWAVALVAFDASALAFGPFELEVNGVTTGLFVATFLRFLAMGTWMGAVVGLRIADAASLSLRARIIGTIAQWSVPVIALARWGVEGGAFGLAAATWFGASVAWLLLVSLGGYRPRHA